MKMARQTWTTRARRLTPIWLLAVTTGLTAQTPQNQRPIFQTTIELVSQDVVVRDSKGQFIPDLQLLFGNYFDQYSEAAKAQKASYVGRRPLNVQLPGLVVQMSGHMRAYSGRAFLPGMLPQGVAADSIR